MDDSRYSWRDFSHTDYAAFANLHNSIFPDRPLSSDTLHHWDVALRWSSEAYPRFVVVDRKVAEIVGIGTISRNPFQDNPRTPGIYAEVRTDHRGVGIGSFLFDKLVAEATRRGATSLRTAVGAEQTAARGFLEKRGFVERRRSWRLVLDVRTVNTAEVHPLLRELGDRGIELTTLEREGTNDPTVLRGIHALAVDTGIDVPQVGAYTAIEFEEFRKFFLAGENALPGACFVAKQGPEYVGMSTASVEPAQRAVLQQGYTATRREHRRKKIALALKLLLVEYARQNGYARIETSNDSLNAPMWTLNQRLGFRKMGELIHVERAFNASGDGTTGAGRIP